jgi:hypothetical protein
VNLVTNHSALIFWRTNVSSDATVRYGLNASVLESESNSTLDTDHRILLDDLQIDRKYWYQVVSDGTESDVYHFRTAPADGDPFTFIVIGDNRPVTNVEPQPEVFEQIAEMIAAEEPHVIIHTGDYVYEVPLTHSEALEKWNDYTEIHDIMGHYAPIYGAIGNHDDAGRTGTRILEYFFDVFELMDEPNTYYSFDYAGAHFVCLDTEQIGYKGRIYGTQLSWLENELTNTDSPLKFVFAHRPMYPTFHIDNGLDVSKAERDAMQQLFEEQNVTAVLGSHDHSYARLTVNGVVHITTGGAGAPLYDTAWGEAYYHYTKITASANAVFLMIRRPPRSTLRATLFPYTGPIEIVLRQVANGSTRSSGTMPNILFSEAPIQSYYSWDSASNSTTLTGIPSGPGYHTLDVYAQGSDGVWSHEQYTFRAPGTPTTPPPEPVDFTLPLLIAGGVGIVVVVVVIALKRRS